MTNNAQSLVNVCGRFCTVNMSCVLCLLSPQAQLDEAFGGNAELAAEAAAKYLVEYEPGKWRFREQWGSEKVRQGACVRCVCTRLGAAGQRRGVAGSTVDVVGQLAGSNLCQS
jgi:hypothetical protein